MALHCYNLLAGNIGVGEQCPCVLEVGVPDTYRVNLVGGEVAVLIHIEQLESRAVVEAPCPRSTRRRGFVSISYDMSSFRGKGTKYQPCVFSLYATSCWLACRKWRKCWVLRLFRVFLGQL